MLFRVISNPIQINRLLSNYNEFTGVTELDIIDVKPEDVGEYSCTAINPLGETTCTATLSG